MEKLSFDKLSEARVRKAEEALRFPVPEGRIRYIARAMYDNLFAYSRANIIYAAFIVASVLVDILNEEVHRVVIAVGMVLILKGIFAFQKNKEYNSYRKATVFPVIEREGIREMATYSENGGYIRTSITEWKNIETIRFYRNFISAKVKEGKDITDAGRSIYLMAENALALKEEIAYFWTNALNSGKDDVRLMLYSEKEMDEISAYIQETFGDFDNVLHEIASGDIHVDIAMIPATEERNYITLCTIGAGAYRMDIEDDIRIPYGISEYAEYLMFLPADWKTDKESLEDERYYWPFRMLKDTARLPVWTNTWLGYGHTISSGEETAEGAPYGSAILTCPAPEPEIIKYADLSNGKTIYFYQVNPITQEELEFKLENGGSALKERLFPEGCDAIEKTIERLK